MVSISIHAAKVGQVIAQPVTNKNGAILCPAGFTLNASVIERLKNAGVDSLAVEGGAPTGPSIDERLSMLEQRFAGVSDPMLLQLKGIIQRRLTKLKPS